MPVMVSVSDNNGAGGGEMMQPSSATVLSTASATFTPFSYPQPPPALAAADFDLRLVSAVVSGPLQTLPLISFYVELTLVFIQYDYVRF